jgi:Na+/glutamate symporter
MTLGVGLPLILMWRRWLGRVTASIAAFFGFSLGASPIAVVAALDHFRGSPQMFLVACLFGACGCAVSLSFWCMALKDE